MEIAIILLVRTRLKSEEIFMILVRFIFPLMRETINHIITSPRKKGACDGRYNLRLAGFVHTIARKDNVRMTISSNNVIALNLRFTISVMQTTDIDSTK